jgi:hypothetical protein
MDLGTIGERSGRHDGASALLDSDLVMSLKVSG